MSSAPRAAAIVAAALLALAPASAQTRWERSAASAYFERARASALSGRDAEALALLREARGFHPADSDALYLEALVSLRAGAPRAGAETLLRTAIAANLFSVYGLVDARRLLARVLYETKRYDEALAVLPDADQDPDGDWVRAACLRYSGERRDFLAVLQRGLARHPMDPRFGRLYFDAGGVVRPGAGAQEAELKSLVLERSATWAVLDPELALRAAGLSGDDGELVAALRAWRATGGSAGAATVLALRHGLIDSRQARAELLASANLAWRDLESLRELSRDAEDLTALAADLAAWSGALVADSNGDGIGEARSEYVAGKPVRFVFDNDQDGHPELDMAFADGAPRALKASLGGEHVGLEYGAWPRVAELRYISGGEARRYWFAPEALRAAVLDFEDFAGSGPGAFRRVERSGVAIPTERGAAAAAFKVARIDLERAEVSSLESSIPFKRYRADASGGSSIMHFDQGSPVLELLDFDGDGVFEGRRRFARQVASPEGVPESLEVDLDGDGDIDYRESYLPSESREWDYSGDGLMDASVRAGPDGGETWEFSSRMDGRYDTAALVRAGRIQRLFRGGVELSLLPDSNPQVLWIGRKPFDLGAALPAAQVGERDGQLFRLYRFSGIYFAELVE